MSLLLLLLAVRDYQTFVYGMPSRTLSAQQNDSLRQAILAGDVAGAIKLFRGTFPDASRAEANFFFAKLVEELKAKHPEKFAAPRSLRDLNRLAMGITLMFELVAFAVFWLMTPSAAPVSKLVGCATGFLLGAGYGSLQLPLSQKPFWRFLATTSALLLVGVAWDLLSSPVAFALNPVARSRCFWRMIP